MERVRHNKLGIGEVVGKEVHKGFTCLNVCFENGTEMRFVIPHSFETGVLEPLGSLKEEVEQVLEDKKNQLVAAVSSQVSAAPAKRSSGRILPNNPIISSFEDYLIAAGYAVETDSGNPSTVFAYINAVDKVCSEEGLSWDGLRTNISTIVPKYDVGGTKELIGAKSNKTVINALKRFAEFVDKP